MPQIGTGGAENQLLQLVIHSNPALVRHQVFYYKDALDREMMDRYSAEGVLMFQVQRNKKRPAKFLWDFSMAIRRVQPDIVHCWLDSGNFWGRIAAILAGVKLIILAWRSPRVSITNALWFLERFTKKYVHHITNSHASASLVAKLIGKSRFDFDVIYNGIDMAKYEQVGDRKSVFAGEPIPSDVKIVTMVGRLTEAKNYPMLLRIARLCKEKNLNVHFVIVGHGEKEAELKTLADKQNINGIVHFLGLRNDVPNILAASDMFCYCSDWEGSPNALLEAMASALPVITTDFDGARELVFCSDVGTVVPRNDADAAVIGIQRYMDNPLRAETIGRNARRFIRSNFEIEIMVQKLIEFYSNILSFKSC